MTLKVIFTKRIETYKKMSVFCNVRLKKKIQFLPIVWKSVLILFKLNYIDTMSLCGSWLYIAVG